MSSILVIAEHRRGELRPVSLEMIAAAQDARQSADDKVVVALIGSEVDGYVSALSVKGADEIVAVKVPTVEFDPDIFEAVVTSLIETRKPAVVLMPHTVDSLGYAATLARKGNFGFASDVFKLEYDGSDLVATRSGYNQKIDVDVDFPGKDCVLLTVRGSVFKPEEQAGSPEVTAEDMTSLQSRSKNLEFIDPPGADDVDITRAEFIMSIGRGVSEEADVEQFRELTEQAGATLCCSRPIADAGWLPKSRQVGQSGKVVGSCKLYVAMGISGSIQHMAGMKQVPTIIAINTDPGAAIFTIAKYGIVCDIYEIGEEMRSLLA